MSNFGEEEEEMESAEGKNLDEIQSLIALTLIDKVGPKTCKSLLAQFGAGTEVFRAKKSSLAKMPFVGEKIAQEICGKKTLAAAAKEIEYASQHKIGIVPWGSVRYPRKLKELEDSPIIFYCAGEIEAAEKPHIAIVGTRTPSPYGRRVAQEFASYFAQMGIVVVSGLAFGVDMEAHDSTMSVGGRTIAVLGHGLEQIYPREHAPKARKIVSTGGALITEFPFGTQPDAYNFPARNRIISGLCDAVVVVEATEKGGALITARMAFEQNREVFAVPGNIGVSTSVGCNRLIRDQVARIACGPQDVLDGMSHLIKFGPAAGADNRAKKIVPLSEREQIVYDLLLVQDLDLDGICNRTGISLGEMRSILFAMELRGVVHSTVGNKYALQAA